MFEHFTTLEEIYCYKLALARTMLQGSIDALDTLEETAMRSDLKDLFRDSAHATRHQLQNLQGCFSLLDQNTNDAPSAAAKGLNRETNALIDKTDSTLLARNPGADLPSNWKHLTVLALKVAQPTH